MPTLSNIPRQFHKGFKLLFTIEDEIFDSIKDGLVLTPLTSSLKKLSDSVSKIKSMQLDTIQRVFYSVGSLTFLLEKGIGFDEIIEDVVAIATREGVFDIDTKELKDRFKQRLRILLESEQLYYAAKADDLIDEYSNVFIQARLITDIRPIFSLKVNESPKAGIIVHNLHIHYKSDEEGDHKDIFISLNSEDVKTLKTMLERAERKERSLQPIFEKSQMTNLSE